MTTAIHPLHPQYVFNSDGTYRHINKTVWMTGSITNAGYYTIRIGNISRGVSRKIYEAFIGPIPSGYEIDHLNSNKLDNRIENLEAVTMGENRRRAQKNNQAFREKAKISLSLMRIIKMTDSEGYVPLYFRSKSHAARYCGISPAMVYQCCEGRQKVSKERYRFEYCDVLPETAIITILENRHKQVIDI